MMYGEPFLQYGTEMANRNNAFWRGEADPGPGAGQAAFDQVTGGGLAA
jgi:hypothetical protein